MANKISGSADAALVAAAGKAAMANVPKDLSGTHERIAKSYAKEAEARGKLWGEATKVIGAVTNKLIEKAKKPSDEIDWNTEGVESIYSVSGDGEDKVDDRFTEPAEGYSKTVSNGVVKNVPYEFRFNPEDYNHRDYDGNTISITPQTTEQKLDELRNQKNNVSKDDFGTRKERKAERRRIRKVMDNVRRSNVDFAAFDQAMTRQLAEGGVNEKASGMYNMQGMMFARAMQSRGKAVSESDPKLATYDGARAVKGYDDNGHMVFTYTDKYGKPFKNKDGSNVTIDKDGLSELFVPVSPKRAVMDVLVDPAPIRKNYKYGFDSFENEIKRSVDSQITDKNTFLDIAFYHGPGGGSLADSLNAIEYDGDKVPVATETPLFGQFMGALEGLSADSKNDLDVTGDGKFTKADYANQESFDLLVNKALSGENLELGKSLLKMHYNTQARKIFDNVVKVNTKVDNQVIVNKVPNTPKNEKETTGNFAHVNRGGYVTLNGVSVQKGSLENIRTDIEKRTPGGFYLGPKDDEKAFVPIGKSGWEQRDGSGEVLATYKSVSELIKSGLKTSDVGFRSLITMDVDNDGNPDGPTRLFNTDFSK